MEKEITNKNNDKNVVMNNIKKWLDINKIVVVYFLCAIFIEMISVLAVEGNPIIRNPFIELGILVLICGIALVIRSNKARFIFCSIFLILQAVLDLAFAVIYDMTGQYFDFGMLNLRNDAFGILESIPMNFLAFYAAMFFCIFFVIFAMRSVRRRKKIEYGKKEKRAYIAVLVIGIIISSISLYADNSEKVDKYDKLLRNRQSSNYSNYGIVGNLVNEFAKGMLFTETDKMSSKKIESFIYDKVSEPTEHFGISKDKNVIVVLVESFEWFSFRNSEEYPNGLGLTDKELEYLFPNLTKFYNESVIMNNFHSREKTDISETFSILGSYPTDKYVDYDYEYNTLPYTVPNILKAETNGKIQTRSFHNGFKSFYNREKTHKIFGFESLTDSYDMYDISDELVKSGKAKSTTMHDYMNNGERNLDSEMINTCKDLMFPTDKRFYTYITSITMHGVYYERENLAEHRKKLYEVYKNKNKENEMSETLVNYVTAVMEFDDALGIMMNDLEKKGLLDNTTIVLFGDHNSYYQQLSNYVKDIEGYDTDNYFTNLYKVPLMIHDSDLGHRVVDKFTCTSDIVPTLLDLLGIRYYTNMYYGNSVFTDKESILYSRAYGTFIGEGIVGRSMNSILYKAPSVDSKYMKYFESESAKLVKKIKYCDQLFYQDYFADKEHYEKFEEMMEEINK